MTPIPEAGLEHALRRVRAAQAVLVIVEAAPATLAIGRSNCLSAAEEARAARFIRESDRRLSRAAHALKRHVLSQLLDCTAEALPLIPGIHGRPGLGAAALDYDFNISHSGGHVAFALVRGMRLGVDLETTSVQPADIMTTISVPDEAAKFPGIEGFRALWSLKEAVSKAIGTGLGEGFPGLRLTTQADQVENQGTRYRCNGWHCRQWGLDGPGLEDGIGLRDNIGSLALATSRSNMPIVLWLAGRWFSDPDPEVPVIPVVPIIAPSVGWS
ncbi:MAG: 4'-phosphopantetheinyl transferase superfamily protein [Salinarimonas sp.]|nr:4'-phosphopantetheinyl transferase superfamily protein [Salinarimonas sp.]